MLIANTLCQCEHERESFLDASIAKSEIIKCNPGNTSYSFIYPINIYRDYTMFLLFKSSILYDFCAFIDCSTPGFPILHHRCSFKLTSIELVTSSNHFILCCPLLFLPSIFPSISIFSKELVLCIRGPKYWEFQFQHQSF